MTPTPNPKNEVATAAQVQRVLVAARKSQLKTYGESLKRLEKVFDAAVKSLSKKIEAAEAGSLRSVMLESLLAQTDSLLANLRLDLASGLAAGMTEGAQAAAAREAAIQSLLKVPVDVRLLPEITKTFQFSEGANVSVSFGQLAQRAVSSAASRVYGDGWKLSDRLYKLDEATRKIVQDTIVQGIVEQTSAKELARKLETSLSAPGVDNPRYKAMRIARTEINVAHRTAHIDSTLDPATRQLKDYILAVGWRLSPSHPAIDICDVWADDDGAGLGSGNYEPSDVPPGHPNCLCYTVSVLKEFPAVSGPNMEPNAPDVSETDARYYAEKYGDPTAQRWLAKYGSETEE